MSKKLIAGAGVVASFAIALAPLATFAAEAPAADVTRVDTLNPTVLDSCTITYTDTTGGVLTNTYAGNVTPGQATVLTLQGEGTPTENKLAITCNYANGYKVTATGGALTESTSGATIASADESAEASFWGLKIEDASVQLTVADGFDSGYKGISGTGTKVVSKAANATAVTTNTFGVSYKVGAATNQTAGAYTGSVTYALVAGAN